MKSPIEMSNGRDTVKIYGVTSRGRPFFQLSFYRAGLRERRTFSDKDAAKREAKIILGQLASSAVATDKAITVTDIESLVAARNALDGLALPLHVAVEAFARSVQALGSPDTAADATSLNPVWSVISPYEPACSFHHPLGAADSDPQSMVVGV